MYFFNRAYVRGGKTNTKSSKNPKYRDLYNFRTDNDITAIETSFFFKDLF